MQTNLLALKTIKFYLKAVYYRVSGGVVVLFFFCSITLLVVVLLMCPLVLEVFRFFFPLLLSTGICVTTVYEFIWSGNQQEGGEISNFEDGNDAENRVVEAPYQSYSRFTFSMEDVCVEVGRVPLPVDATSMDGYVENESSYLTVVKVVLREGGEVERVVAENNGGYEEEEVKHLSSSQQVHKFAEGVWNCYFGREIISDMDK